MEKSSMRQFTKLNSDEKIRMVKATKSAAFDLLCEFYPDHVPIEQQIMSIAFLIYKYGLDLVLEWIVITLGNGIDPLVVHNYMFGIARKYDKGQYNSR
ncbi:MAG: hypothetical protein M5U25_21070 [Planctomycetota bacterium]|nr:hypothetical protein [Planctomycetota bacterium]